MARKKILAIEKEDQEKQVKDGDEQEKDDEKEKDDEEKNEEEDKGSEDEETVEKVARKKKSIKELDDEISDTLINCDLVNLVLEVKNKYFKPLFRLKIFLCINTYIDGSLSSNIHT